MAEDVATLSLGINVGGAEAAKSQLDGFTQAAEQAGEAADALGKKTDGIGDALGGAGDAAGKAGKKVKELEKEVNKFGLSANQVKAGWGNVTQQAFDVGVSLQGGMNPLTVLIQQGPQIATAFGSIGSSMGMLATLINPVTIGVTALVAGLGYLAFQVYDSYHQTEVFNQALAKMGFQSGVTSDQLKEMAENLAASSGASEDNARKAVEAAAGLAHSSQELETYSSVALSVSEQTGEKVDDLVEKFAKLGGDPVKALQDLGDQYGILTPTLYEHVRAMEESGDKAGAYQLVLDAVKDRMDTFKNDQKNALGDTASEWDKLIAKVKTYLAEAEKRPTVSIEEANGGKTVTGFAPLDMANKEAADTAKKTAEQTKKNLASVSDVAKTTLGFVQKTNQVAKDATTSIIESDRLSLQYRTRTERLTDEIAKTEKRNAQIRLGNDKDAIKRSDDLLARQRKQLKEAQDAEDKKNKPKKAAGVKVDAGEKATEQYSAQNLALEAQIKLLQDKAYNEKTASAQRNSYMLLESKMAVLTEASHKRTLTAQEQQLLASKDSVLAEAEKAAQLGDQLKKLQQQRELATQIKNVTDEANLYAQTLAENAGKSSREIANAVRDAQDAAKVRAAGGSEEDVTARISANHTRDEADIKQTQDWASAAKTAYKDWSEAASDSSKLVGDAVTDAMDMGSSAISDFIMNGTNSFKDFTVSVLKMIGEIIVKLTLMEAIKGAASFMGFDMSAKGNAYSGGNLSRFLNGVYTSPHYFNWGSHAFANGGVFAEAGPEAVMPLTRDSSGRLGVRSSGDSSGGVSVSIGQISIGSQGQGDKTGGQANAVSAQLTGAIIDTINTQLRKPGTPLWAAVHPSR